MTVVIEIHGAPVGKGRPRFARRGKFVQTYTPTKTAEYEHRVKGAAAESMAGAPPLSGPVSVAMAIEVDPPASWSKKKREEALSGKILPTTKPDIDNIIKGIFDAINGIVWEDDKQVCRLLVVKRYAKTGRVVAEVRPLESGAVCGFGLSSKGR